MPVREADPGSQRLTLGAEGGLKKRELNASKREGNPKITLNLALFFQAATRAYAS